MNLSKQEIIELLTTQGAAQQALFERSARIKADVVGRTTYLRGLIEVSNRCRKDCLYCGIRKSNTATERYELDSSAVLEAATFAYHSGYGSVVLQAGENQSERFVSKIELLVQEIKRLSDNQLAITLSLGEQSEATYERWRVAGADRYLLRIESSTQRLYERIHPNDALHRYTDRYTALGTLQRLNYQVGTGVMIGLPFQTIENLADDLLFMQRFDIDMCGMGPYIEHPDTPLISEAPHLLPLKTRFDLTLKMVAVLRILMPTINIAATTALQAIDPVGREKAIRIGANVMMPNITPTAVRANYKLYQNKPCTDDAPQECNDCSIRRIELSGDRVALGEQGSSPHYTDRQPLRKV